LNDRRYAAIACTECGMNRPLRLDYASGRRPSHGAPAALPLADVEKVAVRKIDPVTTGLLVGVGLLPAYF